MSKNPSPLTFIPAQYAEGKECFIYYRVQHPETGIMVRKKIKINRIKTATARKKFAQTIVNEINKKLYSGWNPFLEELAPKGYTKLTEAMEHFLREKRKELREDSIRTYESQVKILTEWLRKKGILSCGCVQFSGSEASDFMSDRYDAGISAKTFNNNRLFYTNLWNWMIAKKYCTINGFSGLKSKKRGEKERTIIPPDRRHEIKEYLLATDYQFLVVCMLVFHGLLRPKEICWLKPKHFHLHKQVIVLPGEAAKNGNKRLITISNALMPYLIQWNYNNAENEQFIFSNDYLPGDVPMNARKLSKRWAPLRKKLQLPMAMKLYSLRDSGIVQMLQDGVSPEEVMHHADHSSLDMTSEYLKYVRLEASQQIKEKATSF